MGSMGVGAEHIQEATHGGSDPDQVTRAREFVKRHPYVSITFPRQNGTDEFKASWIGDAADGTPDGVAEFANHYMLKYLVDYLEARFDLGSGR